MNGREQLVLVQLQAALERGLVSPRELVLMLAVVLEGEDLEPALWALVDIAADRHRDRTKGVRHE